MKRFPLWILAGLATLASGVGCTPQSRCCQESEAPPVIAKKVQRTNMEMVLKDGAGPAQPRTDRVPTYFALTPDQCRCVAAEVQDTARMLDRDAEAFDQQLDRPCVPHAKARLYALKRDILHAEALELRNVSAGLALSAYFRIVESEALSDVEYESLRFVGEGLDHMRDLQSKGLRSAEDYESLHRQELDMLSDLTRLQLAADELNTELARRLEQDRDCQCLIRFWPTFTVHRVEDIPDCDAAVEVGLKHRAELWMLQRIEEDLDVKMLPAVRKTLSMLNTLLGSGDPKPVLMTVGVLLAVVCDAGPLAREVEKTRQQVAEHQATRRLEIASEIRQDVGTLHHMAQLLALTRQRIRSLYATVEDLRIKESRGLVAFDKVLQARLNWLNARSELVKQVVLWEREWIQLGAHQGLLELDCHAPGKGCPPPVTERPPVPVVAVQNASVFSSRLSYLLSEGAPPAGTKGE